MRLEGFAPRLLDWWDRHGRKDLPWQLDPTPYRVWVSEIMLQQTQVATVIDYYQRFMQRFPDALALARAPLDEVLGLWSGLGYYARARNLHRAAQLVAERFEGELPTTLEPLMSLPGIGRSTAAAILALSGDQPHAILDGNVKRVLARLHAIEGHPSDSRVLNRLWALSESHTPKRRAGNYTQAIMDLGATLCTRRKPTCLLCPAHGLCAAHQQGLVDTIPAPRPKKALPTRVTRFLVVRDRNGHYLLERRPSPGIWGGLWCFPECEPEQDWQAGLRERFGLCADSSQALSTLQHGFTHFRLDIQPLLVEVKAAPRDARVAEGERYRWVAPARIADGSIGIPRPVRALLDELD
ncbi:MAG: A/G-specific adenine glycosylase [Gammaproteobacteria bacterium]|nr:A/G-specific adenine glycosylase [Gammaproteobacteria bacterium]